MNRRMLFSLLWMCVWMPRAFGQACPTGSFTVQTDLCINESLQLDNTSANGAVSDWDFCIGDLSKAPTQSNLGTFGFPYKMEVVDSLGQYYAFVSNRNPVNIFRLDFGTSLSNTPSAPKALDVGVAQMFSVEIFSHSGKWYGYVIEGSGKLYRLEFGADLTSKPNLTLVGQFGGLTSGISLEYQKIGNSHLLFVLGYANTQLVRLDFGSDPLNLVPAVGQITISGLSTGLGLSLIKECDTWYGFVASNGNNKVYKINFGSDLMNNSPVITDLGVAMTSIRGITAIEEYGAHYLFGQTGSGNVYRVDFGSSYSNTGVQLNNLTNLGVLTNNSGFGIYQEGSRYYGFSSENFTGGKIYRLTFPNVCNASTATSTAFEPKNIFYSQAGTYTLGLKATDTNGNSRSTRQTVTVGAAIAPDIRFNVDHSRCVSNANTFSAQNTSGDINSYSWDFGDGNSSATPNPTHQYAAAGTYEVSLTVDNGTCENVYVDTLTIYPEPSAASFTLPSGSQCTSTLITFTNTTDESGFTGGLQYLWDFNGEATSTLRNPTYIFPTSGEKEISLIAYVPGCSTTLFTQQLSIIEDISPSFIYSHNCFGQDVAFTSTTPSANIIGYTWSFGDGATSNQENPLHTFATAEKFAVTLAIETTSGCISSVTDTVNVSFAPLASITSGNGEANVPISLTGNDLTSIQDAVTGWNWKYENNSFSTNKNTQISFPTAGVYEVALEVATSQGCVDEVKKNITVAAPVCPYPDFTVQTDLCINESLQLDNTSANGAVSDWDFCIGDLSKAPTQSNLGTFGFPYKMEVVDSLGQYYAFVSNRNPVNIFRLDFGTSLSNTPSAPKALDVGVAQMFSVEIFSHSGKWYGYVIEGSGKLYRLEFGADLTSKPNLTLVGQFGGLTSGISLEYQKIGNSHLLFVLGYANTQLVRLDFGSDPLNLVPAVGQITISGLSTGLGLSLIKECDTWYGFVASNGNNKVYKINFGSDLMNNSPVITDLGVAMTSIRGITAIEEYGAHYLFGQTGSGNVYRVDFGSSYSNTGVQLNNLTNLGVLTNNSGFGIYQEGSRYYGFSSENFTGGKIYRLTFPNICNASTATSTAFEPKNISYSQGGTYQIGLRVTDANGHSRSTRQTVTVGEELAPDIGFSYQAVNCEELNFSFEVDQDVFSSYEWDFGDGQIGSGAQVNHQFVTAGSYNVSIKGETINGCSNNTSKSINIYAAPPNPAFEIQSAFLCTGQEITLLNETSELGYDVDQIVYEWSIGAWTSNEKSPILSIDTVGTFEVTLRVNIPGCESEPVSQFFTLKEGIKADFSFVSSCADFPVPFINLTGDPSASYVWDFGDGFSSTAEQMDHLYAEGGTYTVTLTATKPNGCIDIVSKDILVDTPPNVDFEYSLLCTNTPSTFTDLSVADNADIIAWQWFVDDELVSEEQNPAIIFETSGLKNLRLVVFASSGCEAALSENIFVIDAPELVVTSELGCLGFASKFTDETGVSQSRLWIVDGVTQAATGATMTYTFNTPGLHTVTLTATQTTNCSATKVIEVNIPANPVLSISVDGECANQDIFVEDISVPISGNAIVSRTWSVEGVSFGNGKISLLPVDGGGNYEVKLDVITAFGCQLSSTRNVKLLEAPTASFNLSTNYGVPPFTISTTNSSTGATGYTWFIDNQQVSTQASPLLTISSQGTKNIKMVARNAVGCTDSVELEVISALSKSDLVIEKVELITNGSTRNLLIELRNQGNLPVEEMDFAIKLEKEFTLSEKVIQRIEIGKRAIVRLSTGIPAANSLSYLCVAVSNIRFSNDLSPENNEWCMTLQSEKSIIEPPYPNPTEGITTVRTVLTLPGKTSITVMDMLGQVHISQVFDQLSAGLHVFPLDLTALDAGTYLVYIQHPSGEDEYKITKR